MNDRPATRHAKAERRDKILDAAWLLFDEFGYDSVTMAQIARQTGVATRTVFNHFPRKEDIVFQRTGVVLAAFERSIRERPAGTRLSDGIRDNALAMLDFDPGFPREFLQMARVIAASPTLRRRRFEMFEAHSLLVKRALLERDPSLGRGGLADGLSQALVSIHWAVMEERGAAVARGDGEEAVRDAAVDAITRGYALLRAGFADIDV